MSSAYFLKGLGIFAIGAVTSNVFSTALAAPSAEWGREPTVKGVRAIIPIAQTSQAEAQAAQALSGSSRALGAKTIMLVYTLNIFRETP